ncbi:hypothetical protein Pka01_39830 [Planotetraspora kaengkrachanensis]|uniref:Uncharacterized protein n=2 Tax=Planotetraspora kaengkrachanensis TaxID=575193 RepID=A0A8J3M7G9_9ACTN|nr:hypothetical protein Pka01_39830 [Planotetraspora kaengkrachanensis]
MPVSPAAADPLPWGPYTCAQGRVWRLANAGDLVCTWPERRTDVAAENSSSPSHKLLNTMYCMPGYEWRLANPSDRACVTSVQRRMARMENESAAYSLADPAAVPLGGVSVMTRRGAGGVNYLYAKGTGLTLKWSAEFYAVGVKGPDWPTGRPRIGEAWPDAPGTFTDWTYIGQVTCVPSETKPVPVVVVDLGTGMVTRAGTTDAFMCWSP